MFNFLNDTSCDQTNVVGSENLNSVEPRVTVVYNDVLWVFVLPV